MTVSKKSGQKHSVPSLFSLLPTRKDNIFQITIKLISLLLPVIMIIATCRYTFFFSRQYSEWHAADNIRRIYSAAGTAEQKSAAMTKINPEYFGWLTIDGTAVNDPVVLTDHPEIYRRRDFCGNRSSYGTVFLSRNKQTGLLGGHLALYGNSPQDGNIFACLSNYRQSDYFSNHPIVRFTTASGTHYYAVFAVLLIDPRNPDKFVFQQSEFSNEDTFLQWYSSLTVRSLLMGGIDVSRDDRFLSLITENNSFDGAQLVVMARALRNNETLSACLNATSNPTPRYPDRWYTTRGLEIPDEKTNGRAAV